MIAVETQTSIPITTTCTIAWDSPSTWTDPIPPTPTIQPLTKANLTQHACAHLQLSNDSQKYIRDWYSASLKNSYPSPPLSATSDNKRRGRKISSTTTQNVAIDAYPLPFPYHNDSTFLPTVETGRTRFDSESTQSLYDSQPSSPTSSVFKRQQYTATRRRCSTSTSLTPTLTTTATTRSDMDQAAGWIPKDSGMAKKHLKAVLNRPRRLSILLEKGSTHSDSVYHPQRQVPNATKPRSTVSATLSTAHNHAGVRHPWVSDWHHDQAYRPSPSDTYQQPRRPAPPPPREAFFFRLIRKIWPVKHF